jgi:hypothetical protein
MLKGQKVTEFVFRDCEYVTPAGELWHWRRAFLRTIERHAPQVLVDLASYLPLRHAIAEGRKHFDEYEKEDQDIIKNADLNFVFELHRWLRKYGFNEGRLIVARVAKRKGMNTPAELAKRTGLPLDTCKQIWISEPFLTGMKETKQVCETLASALDIMPHRLLKTGLVGFWGWMVALDTLQYWDEDNPSETAKTFVPIGLDVHKKEILLAYPESIAASLSGTTAHELTKWEIEKEAYRAAAKKGELILPPEPFATWAPFRQPKDDYLKSQQGIITRLIGRGDRHLANNYRRLLDSYCDRIEAHYKRNGYKKLGMNRKNAEQQILWTVQAHVLNRPYGCVTGLSGEPVLIGEQGVKARVEDVLEKLDLAPRENRKADRKANDRL